MEQEAWQTTFQVTIPEILEPERFKLGRKKFLDRLWREIEPLRKELGYPVEGSKEDRLIWQIGNRASVEQKIRGLCTALSLPSSDDFVLLMQRMFFDGINDSPVSLIDSAFSPYVRDATPLFFMAVAIPPDTDTMNEEDRERFLTNGLFIEGMIPGLSRESLTAIFQHNGDYVIRGNLALFNANAFREIGKWLEEIKNQIGAQNVFEIRPGRGPVPSHQGDETALRMYEVYLDVKKLYRDKLRKQRKGRSRYPTIYDEVGRNYKSKYRLEVGSLSANQVKYLVQKGKHIFEAGKGRINPA